MELRQEDGEPSAGAKMHYGVTLITATTSTTIVLDDEHVVDEASAGAAPALEKTLEPTGPSSPLETVPFPETTDLLAESAQDDDISVDSPLDNPLTPPASPDHAAATRTSVADPPTSVVSATAKVPGHRLDDHDSLVTVRLSEPLQAIDSTDAIDTTEIRPLTGAASNHNAPALATPESQPATAPAARYTSPLETMPTVNETDELAGGALETPDSSDMSVETAGSAVGSGNAVELMAQAEQDESAEQIEQLEQFEQVQLELGQVVAARTTTTIDEIELAENNTTSSDDTDDYVNWDKLQQTENEEHNAHGAVDNTAVLLARLEEENAKLATNPKSAAAQAGAQPPTPPQQSHTRKPRPPSMAQLRDMVRGPQPPALRYSMLPPPPMTDLEFYAALVQDYRQTAARLPTLLANKIRKGIPPPLRGVVWQSMTSAVADSELALKFDQLCNVPSAYDAIIAKDLDRSFPGVDMFREPEGNGQRMLGRVLKSYSLHDPGVGYCQGLAFLAGPLVMHMPDRDAFRVLVKLMNNYDLRSSYLPDLSGLHVRIYQFRRLLRTILPDLSSHLDDLQVDPAVYVSQWFLSFFAVACPLPMLFRMLDVAFAEGAAVTIMRVAVSLMQKNQARLLACSELDDAIQLLLSRGLWDCYHYNADEFVLHFANLSSVVTTDRLASLEQNYREAQISNFNQTDNPNVDRSSAIATAVSRLRGRLWFSSYPFSAVKPAATAPPVPVPAPAPPPAVAAAVAPAAILSSSSSSFSPPSAQSSFASSSASSSSTSSLTPTATTTTTTILHSTSHLSSSPLSSAATTPTNNLLPAGWSSGLGAPPARPLSMLRRSTSKQSLASTVNSMEAASSSSIAASTSSSISSTSSASVISSDGLSADPLHPSSKSAAASNGATNKTSDNDRYLHSQIEDLLTALSDLQKQNALLADQLQREREERSEDNKAVQSLLQTLRDRVATAAPGGTEELASLVGSVESRFEPKPDNRRSSIPQTKLQLRDELARAKEQLANELAKGQDRNRRVYELEQEMTTMKDQLRDSHTRARELHQDKQRLERQIHDVRTRVASTAATAAIAAVAGAAQITNPGAVGNGMNGVGSGNGAGAHNSSGLAGAASGGAALGIADAASEWFGRAKGFSTGTTMSVASGGTGLRELKLGRSKSTPTQTSTASATAMATGGPLGGGVGNKRMSSLIVRGPGRRESVFGVSATAAAATAATNGNGNGNGNANNDQQQEALVLELVQAKTAEAVARQEAEEARQKLESLRKALGLSPSDMASVLHMAGSNTGSGAAAAAASAAMGMLGRLTTSISDSSNAYNSADSSKAAALRAPASAPATTTTTTGYGGFFSWRR